jgi:hypothetical protein
MADGDGDGVETADDDGAAAGGGGGDNRSSGPHGSLSSGFICPICRLELRSEGQLTRHYERQHGHRDDGSGILKTPFEIAQRNFVCR